MTNAEKPVRTTRTETTKERPMTSGLGIHTQDHVGWIVLERPDRKNAFTVEMLDRWAEALRRFQRDDDVRVVVVRGVGDAFCAGADLGQLADDQATPLDIFHLMSDSVHQVIRAVEDLTKPYIAAVNGVAVGAGMDMALMCDYRIAAANATLSEGYVRVGLVPGDGGAWYLPRLIGRSRALRLLWTGEFVDADRAQAWGIVDEVVPDDEIDGRVAGFAHELAHQPPVAVQMIKRAVGHSEGGDLRASLDLIAAQQAVVVGTRDSREAMAAFRDRRTPVFEGK